MSSPDRFVCPAPACRMFCGLISPDGRLPQAPQCPTENCPAIAALSPKFNRIETAATATIDRAIAARKRRAADADEPTPAEAVPGVATCDGEIGLGNVIKLSARDSELFFNGVDVAPSEALMAAARRNVDVFLR